MKYKQHREEITHALTVSTELLTLLTREGLLDIADCVKYQVNTSLLSMAMVVMVDRNNGFCSIIAVIAADALLISILYLYMAHI